MEASNLSYTEKADLIRKDPVTCMRHFDHRFKKNFKTILESEKGIFSKNKISDYFTPLEFQARGSPQSHGLYWLENSPEYIPGDDESIQKCCQFIDEYITCERNESPEIEKIMGYQIHKHSHTFIDSVFHDFRWTKRRYLSHHLKVIHLTISVNTPKLVIYSDICEKTHLTM